MKKITSILLAAMIVFTLTSTTAFAASASEAQQPVKAEKTFHCPTIPEPMQPGSVIEYTDNSNIKIIKGGFRSEDYTKDLTKPGLYPKPVKGLVVEYADDGLISRFKYPEGEDPDLKPLAPGSFKARASAKSDTITLTWKKSYGVNGHKVYRSTTKSGTYKLIKKLNSENTIRYNDKNLTKGKTYYYKLVPYLDYKGKIINGKTSSVVNAKVRS